MPPDPLPPRVPPGAPSALEPTSERRVTLSIAIAVALPLVVVAYLIVPYLFPRAIGSWAYQGAWVFVVFMAVALALLQVTVLRNYLDLRHRLNRLTQLTMRPAAPAMAALGAVSGPRGAGGGLSGREVSQEVQALVAAGQTGEVGPLLRELTRVLGVLERQGSQVQEYARRFETINEELRTSNLRLREMSLTDELTEVGNRRNFEMRVREELNRSTRFGHAFSLLLLDIDAFKGFNDDFGHLAGDAALRGLGALMRSIARDGDVACRIGGEEFAFILPETVTADAAALAERVRRGVEGGLMAPDGSRALTVSIGLAAFPQDGKTKEDLLGAADAALYESKHRGRNRVTVFARRGEPGPTGASSAPGEAPFGEGPEVRPPG